MSHYQTLHVEVEGTGITEPLSRQINLLGDLLGDVIRERAGEEMLDLVEDLRQLCKQALQENDPSLRAEAEARIRQLDLDAVVWLLRAYTAFFHLINQAEQQEIVRINRERARASEDGPPRTESIDDAIHQLKQDGRSLEEVHALLSRLDIQPTMTAHPTEARRRSVLYKQQKVTALLTALSRGTLTPEEHDNVLAELRNQIALLLVTDEVRAERPTVEREVEWGLYFVRNTIWETVPRIHADVRRALRKHYGSAPEVPGFLRYRSWIGSDRDGNPFVTPEVTRRTVRMQRQAALRRYIQEVRMVRRVLSLSDRRVEIPTVLRDSLEADAREVTLDAETRQSYRHEPFRLKLSYVMARLQTLLRAARHPAGPEAPRPPAYDSARFCADLEIIRQALLEVGMEGVAEQGAFADLLVRARTFGFYLMALDVRQHSRVHEEAVAELLRLAGVAEDYAALSEEERLAVLERELNNPRPLLPRGVALPDDVQEVMDTFALIAELLEEEPGTVGSYVVSMTHEVSDLLEVMLLAKEAGLTTSGDVTCPLDLVPLFETVEDLAGAEAFMEKLFRYPIYQKQLERRGRFQEIMLGYSDSNKDGGYWMANASLHRAQFHLAALCQRHGVELRLFHGRGGSIGRGGGRAGRAIRSLPAAAQNGRIRFTEQGEVISFRYALGDVARRHLEQITHAVLLTSASRREDAVRPEARLMDTIAERSMEAYRDLIEAPTFWGWYTRATPVEHISRLPIASRPVSRKGAGQVDFEGLRAIPWNFAWTQTRYMVPGWFGMGTGLQAALEDEERAEALRQAYQTWPFLQAVVDNAQLEMARARLVIAQHYARLALETAPDDHPDLHPILVSEFELAKEAILRITGQEELLEKRPVIQKSIRLRNPYTDVLNFLQIELLRRYRAADEADRPRLRDALFLSINGIAAAVQSTG